MIVIDEVRTAIEVFCAMTGTPLEKCLEDGTAFCLAQRTIDRVVQDEAWKNEMATFCLNRLYADTEEKEEQNNATV